jgi:aminopeptidase-like protein
MENFEITGAEMHNFAKKIWSYNRSLTGIGQRQTLSAIKEQIPQTKIKKYRSGKRVFDWKIPDEWHVNYAYIIGPNGEKICDYSENNLHLIGYSEAIEQDLSLDELQSFLHSIPGQPDAIPYITSYYEKRWGFCITEKQRLSLKKGVYKVSISTTKKPGTLEIGEIYIPGRKREEVFISTYICHPSMANDIISGITVSVFLAKLILGKLNREYSYRFVFLPETIGSITYLNENYKMMKKYIIAGFNLSCIGDDRNYSYLPSRQNDTLSDKAALHVLNQHFHGYKSYSWLDRGSDERQYCAPGIDLPIASLMRTKYGQYPEYHTSLDNLENVVTPSGLAGGLNLVWKVIQAIELNVITKMQILGEPMMSQYDLYPTLGTKYPDLESRLLMNIITYSDGERSLIDIANLLNEPIEKLYDKALILKNLKIIDF